MGRRTLFLVFCLWTFQVKLAEGLNDRASIPLQVNLCKVEGHGSTRQMHVSCSLCTKMFSQATLSNVKNKFFENISMFSPFMQISESFHNTCPLFNPRKDSPHETFDLKDCSFDSVKKQNFNQNLGSTRYFNNTRI